MEDQQATPQSPASKEHVNRETQNSQSSFAFIVHSQDAVYQKIPPSIDNQRLARQKRRRTSPEDQNILEAEYGRNSKPDKAARMDIVNRVALGEKEVQIWFQNRRQMTRRKTKPLLPHEVLANLRSSQNESDNTTFPGDSVGGSSQQQLSSSQSSIDSSHSTGDNIQLALCDTGLIPAGLNIPVIPQTNVPTLGGNKAPISRGPGYISNRRKASFITCDDMNDAPSFDSQNVENDRRKEHTSRLSRSYKRTSSQVRLSLSLDGKAQVTTSTGDTPSPPRSQPELQTRSIPRPPVGLQRSHSAVEPSNNSALDIFSAPYSRRRMTGRSRDTRTWEFYCDADARNALTEQAKREEIGSATAAIGLIRSQSNNSKNIAPNLNKRNTNVDRRELAEKSKAEHHKAGKQKLARASSSLARLQTTKLQDEDRKPKSHSMLFGNYEGDSDKENWEPGTRTSAPRRRRSLNSQPSRLILEESSHFPSQATNNAPREEDDLDCVQNLLSLSQAAWV